MKSLHFALSAGLILAASSFISFANHNSEESLVERVSKIGAVNVMTDDEKAEMEKQMAEQASAAEDAGPADGAAIYAQSCGLCHDAGVGGAPIVGNAEQWTARIDKGLETLIENAINGFNGDAGVMPAKGGNPALSDEEVTAAVEYMVEQSQ